MVHKQKIRIGAILGGIATILTIVVTALNIDWVPKLRAINSFNFLYDNVEQLEHLVTDHHDVLGLGVTLDSLIIVLKENQEERDSLIHIIELVAEGKFPYDSLWVKGPSGNWYITTIKTHWDEEHH